MHLVGRGRAVSARTHNAGKAERLRLYMLQLPAVRSTEQSKRVRSSGWCAMRLMRRAELLSRTGMMGCWFTTMTVVCSMRLTVRRTRWWSGKPAASTSPPTAVAAPQSSRPQRHSPQRCVCSSRRATSHAPPAVLAGCSSGIIRIATPSCAILQHNTSASSHATERAIAVARRHGAELCGGFVRHRRVPRKLQASLTYLGPNDSAMTRHQHFLAHQLVTCTGSVISECKNGAALTPEWRSRRGCARRRRRRRRRRNGVKALEPQHSGAQRGEVDGAQARDGVPPVRGVEAEAAAVRLGAAVVA